MEKKKLTQEMIDSGANFEALGFCVTHEPCLPYSECEACATEQAEQAIVYDPCGIVYEAYNAKLTRQYLALKYFTDLDTEDWNTPEGRVILHDLVARSFDHGSLTSEVYSKGWWTVDEIYDGLYEAIKARVERVNSLSYKVGKTFESILGDEDIIKRIAENREITEKLIDMMKILENKEKESHKKTPLNIFAKK